MTEDRVIRLSRRWAVGIAVWLIAVPAALLALKAVLPSDNLLTAPPGNGDSAGVVVVQPVGTIAGIRAGDDLLAIDGIPISEYLHGTRPGKPIHAGDVLTYRVRSASGGPERDVPVRVHGHPDLGRLIVGEQPDAALVSVAMLLLAAWLLWRRPDELAAHTFLLFTAGWASSTVSAWAWTTPLDLVARPWTTAWAYLGIGGYLTSGIATLLFAFAFPRPLRWFRRRLWILAAAAPLLLSAALAGWAAADGPQIDQLARLDAVAEFVWQPCVVAALVLMVVRWVRLRADAEARRRTQIVVLGFATALVAMLVGKWLAIPPGTFGFGLVLLIFP
ncbi:MAG TPA: hypothetical protein VHA75_02385, partial [Rugosimonospora sp.]|nr:hypothetical protein [Rugosimonospora sp.]